MSDVVEVTATNQPIPVVQVAPELKKEYTIALLFLGIGSMFLKAWLVMLILPVVTPLDLGYWQSMLLIIGANILVKSPQRMLHSFKSLKGK